MASTDSTSCTKLQIEDSIQLKKLITNGNLSSVVKFLNKKGASVNSVMVLHHPRTFPLHVAVSLELPDYRHEICEYFISQGANLNILDDFGYAPLHYSLLQYNVTATKALLVAGADVNLPLDPLHVDKTYHVTKESPKISKYIRHQALTSWGDQRMKYYPLDIVLRIKLFIGNETILDLIGHDWGTYQMNFIHLLLSHGADVNVYDGSGLTPLHHAVGFNKDAELVDILLRAGADINALSQRKQSETPLCHARDVQMLTYLLSKNANLEFTNEHGRNVLVCSVKRRCFKVTRYLISEMPALLHVIRSANNISPFTKEMVALLVHIWYLDKYFDDVEQTLSLLLRAGWYPSGLCTTEDWNKLKKNMKSSTWTPAAMPDGLDDPYDDELLIQNWDRRADALLKTMDELEANPRSLADLCTIRIRSCLWKNVSSKVHYLPLPTKLKDKITLARDM